MGLGGGNEPPKKKLKQAQLCFTPKGQKRKLVSEDDDDVQFVKIICKEPSIEGNENISDKENHLSPNQSIPLEAEKKTKLSNEPLEKNVSEISKTESTSILTEENAFLSPQDVKASHTPNTSDNQKNNPDISLSISDSVLDVLNTAETVEDADTTKDETFVTPEKEKSGSEGLSSQEEEKHETSELNNSLDDSVLNDTLKSDDGNDTACLSSSNEDSTPNKSQKLSSLKATRKLTPKRLESIKKKEELQRLKMEKKAERAKLKEEKIKAHEEEKKRRREEREKKKQEELRLKEEERKAKDEEKRKRDEEKKQKEERKEEKRKEKEEERRKKEEIEEKKKAAFAKFFTKSNKQSDIAEKNEDLSGNNFMPFPMKPDMKLASIVRRVLEPSEKELLDSCLENGSEKDSCSYLDELKSGKHTPLKTEATWPVSMLEEEHDVIIIESTTNENCSDTQNDLCSSKEKKKKMKAKLLQFQDNRRPPYWGTWRKKSKFVNPRKPLGQDKEVFDYEVDSDLEWEDEGEGEDIDKEGDSDGDGSGDEEEATTEENGYMLDNTFVPHGYLSDEEVQPDEDIEDNEPEDQKIRMKVLKQEFDEEMKAKTERLKPRLLGCVWISNGITEVSSGSLYEGLMAYRAVWDEEAGPIDITGPIIEDSPSSTPQTKKIFPKTVLSSLVKFLHGCCLPLSAIIKEFLLLIEKEHPSEHVSKRAITLKVKEIASKTYDYSTGKPIWAINPTLLEEFGLKPLNEVKPEPPPVVVPVQILEKPKESPLINFFKGTGTPPVKKKVPFVTLSKPSFEYTPGKLNERGSVKDFGTPRPNPGVRKRAQLITLSTTIGNSTDKDKSSVPADNINSNENSVSNTAKSSDTVVDLCDNSQ